jgi:hypothetical protein
MIPLQNEWFAQWFNYIFSNNEQMLMTWDKHEKVVAINDMCYLNEIGHTNS